MRYALSSLILAMSFASLPCLADHDRWYQLEEKAEKAFLEGNAAGAEKVWDEALKEAEKSDPQGLDAATTLNQLTHLRVKEKNFQAARTACERALAIREKHLGKDNLLTAQTLSNLALISHKLGEDERAEESYRSCIAIKEKLLGKDAPELAVTMHNLAKLLSDHHKCGEATLLYKQAVAIDRKALGDHVELSRDITSLGIHQFNCRAFADAATSLSEALAVAERVNAEPDEVVPILHYLALAHAQLKHPEKARAFNERVLAIQERKNGKGHHENTVHLLNIARNADEMGKTQESERLYLEAVGSLEKQAELHPYQLTECRLELAHFYRRHGQLKKADEEFREAIGSYDKLTDPQKSKLYELPMAYADLLAALKRPEESKAMEERYLHVHKAPDTHKPAK